MEKQEKFVTLKIGTSKIVSTLLAIVTVLVLASVITQAIRFLLLDPEIHRFSRFNLDAEANIPTYFSTMILFFSAVLLGMIALFKKKESDPYAFHWAVLSLIFFVMSIDEAAAIHEMSIKPLRSLLGAGGFFHYTWIIAGAVFFVIVVIMFLKFWLHLPYRTRILFALAALCYVSGAIGFEGISGFYKDVNKVIDFTYILITTVEETLELIGIVLFIYALLRYLVSSYPRVRIHINFR